MEGGDRLLPFARQFTGLFQRSCGRDELGGREPRRATHAHVVRFRTVFWEKPSVPGMSLPPRLRGLGRRCPEMIRKPWCGREIQSCPSTNKESRSRSTTWRKEFVKHEQFRASCHAEVLEKIPRVKDLQCVWFILLYCEVSRANFFIRAVSPLVAIRPETRNTLMRYAANWARWADGERHLEVAATILRVMDEMFLKASRPSTFAPVIWKQQVSWFQVGFSWSLERSTWLTRRTRKASNRVARRGNAIL